MCLALRLSHPMPSVMMRGMSARASFNSSNSFWMCFGTVQPAAGPLASSAPPRTRKEVSLMRLRMDSADLSPSPPLPVAAADAAAALPPSTGMASASSSALSLASGSSCRSGMARAVDTPRKTCVRARRAGGRVPFVAATTRDTAVATTASAVSAAAAAASGAALPSPAPAPAAAGAAGDAGGSLAAATMAALVEGEVAACTPTSGWNRRNDAHAIAS